MIYFLKTPLFHIQREIFRTLPAVGKVRLAERRVTQSRALPTYSIGLHSAVYAVNIQRPKAEGLSKKWVAFFSQWGPILTVWWWYVCMYVCVTNFFNKNKSI